MGLRVNKAPFKLSAYTTEDSDGNAMLKSHAYLAQSAGSINAFVSVTAAAPNISGYVGFTNDPVTDGVKVDSHSDDTQTMIIHVSFLVAKGEYFEIRADSTSAVNINWKSVGALIKPVDFN